MIKKTSKKTKPKPPVKSSTDTAVSQLKKTIAAQAREIREGAEQQAATSEVLHLIARTSADLQSVMKAIAENAARLCEADNAQIFRLEGDHYPLVASFGSLPDPRRGE